MFTTSQDGELCQAADAMPMGLVHEKIVGTVAPSDDGISAIALGDEVAIVDPLRLNKLELPGRKSINHRQHQAAVHAVILHLPFRQNGAIGRATPQKHVEIHIGDGVLESITRVGATDVATKGGDPSLGSLS